MTTEVFMTEFKGDNTTKKFDEILRSSIEKYFEEKLPTYDRKSIRIEKYSHKDDWYLSRVMAKKVNGDNYTCWTCYNLIYESMNFGHYDLTEKQALDILYNGVD